MKNTNLTLITIISTALVVGALTFVKTKQAYNLKEGSRARLTEAIQEIKAINTQDSTNLQNLINGDVKESYFVKSVRTNLQKTTKINKEILEIVSKEINK